MKYWVIFLFFLCGINATAQDSAAVSIYCPNLRIGENFSFGKKAIKFKEVVSDSRCPRKVTCIWEGEAKVLIELYEDGVMVSEKMVAVGGGAIPLKFSTEENLFQLTKTVLEPYPSIEKQKEDLKYILHIYVEENTN